MSNMVAAPNNQAPMVSLSREKVSLLFLKQSILQVSRVLFGNLLERHLLVSFSHAIDLAFMNPTDERAWIPMSTSAEDALNRARWGAVERGETKLDP